MRKLFSFGLVLVFGIVLSGCDLIPSDVQEDIENLVCVDDPDNPICDLETLQNLEEEIVIDLIEEVMLKAKEKANKTKCESLIAPGSTELIEACSVDDYFFLPEGVDEFTPVTVVSDGLYYKVTGITDDELEELTIMVKIVLVDTTYLIEDWEMSLVTLQDDEITYDRAKLFVSQFVVDYQDPTISNDDFCAMYYSGPPYDNDCDGDRTEFLESGITIEIEFLESDPDKPTVVRFRAISIDEEGVSEESTVEVEVFRQEFGQVRILRITADGEDNDCDTSDPCEVEVTLDEVKMLFEMFVDDYFDSTTTDEDLNETYFRSMDPDFFENRVEDLESGLQVTVLEVSHNVDSFFDIFIEVSVDGETDQQTLPIKVHKDELGLYFEFLDDDDDCDGVDCDPYTDRVEEVRLLFDMFILDYFNTDYPADYLNQMYFRGMGEEFFENRTFDIENGLMVELLDVEYVENNFFEIYLKMTEDGEMYEQTLPIMVYEDDAGLYFQFINPSDHMASQVEMLFAMFIEDYFNTMYTDEELNTQYFRGMGVEFFENRAIDIDNGLMVDLLYVNYNDNGIFEVFLYIKDGIEEYDQLLPVMLYEDELGYYFEFLDIDDDCDSIDECYIDNPEEIFGFIEQMLMYYGDPTISDDEFYSMYNLYMFPSSFPQRSSILDGHVTVLKAMPTYDSFFDIEVEVRTQNGVSHWTLEVRVNRIDMAIIVNDPIDEDCDDICDDIVNPDEVLMYFNQFLADFTNPEITEDELRIDYNINGLFEFLEARSIILDGHVTVLKISHNGDGSFNVNLEEIDSTGAVEHWTLEVRVNRLELLIIVNDGEDNDCDGVCDYVMDAVEVQNITQDFFSYFVNEMYTDDEVANMFFYMYGSEFLLTRPDFIGMNYTATIQTVMAIDDDTFEVEVLFENSQESDTVRYHIRVNRIDMAYHLEINVPGNPLSNPMMLTLEEASTALNGYVTKHNGMSIMSSAMCPTMVVESQIEQCAYDRDMAISSGYVISHFEVSDQGGGIYLVSFTYSGPVDSYVESYHVMFYMGELGYLLELYTTEPYDEMTMVTEYLGTYLMYLNDPTITLQETCIFVSDDSYDECVELKTFLDTNLHMASISNLYYDDLDMLVALFDIIDVNGVLVGSVEYNVGVSETPDSPLYQDRAERGVNPLYEQN